MKNENYEIDITQCPIAPVQKVISGKWNMVIIYFLSQGVMRFGELQRKLPGVTQAALTKQLRLLEEYKMVHREIYKQVPPKVEYSLTETGIKFLPVLTALEEWATEYQVLESSALS
ncbi:HxlR family HTH transcriptional regulator [Gottschalkia acidurici 9a]|uniref:HxlR family HTH transcriptional regulator n=1 Tax=Gottschalkia acidurici (strain ATCC 7906 / DSM 604 / BCRC 14475 / CIP 104303 / KCTC 5404 / NCIMB 10678 / 9a) TaxID=1128398 RepID=K0AXH2_GOTA9|nr:helix-turn-helix domain-containing protein [Gottschalkia acidurici]AFS78523.1 HxlR family HTH transcriptional regulator [Gottschalkia acidurici 9a]